MYVFSTSQIGLFQLGTNDTSLKSLKLVSLF